MSDLRSLFAPELVDAIERLVDERVAAALAERDNGDEATPWLTILEAAGYLCVSERTVQRLLARGRIRWTAIGRRRLLHRDDLDAFLSATTGEDVAPTTSPRRRGE